MWEASARASFHALAISYPLATLPRDALLSKCLHRATITLLSSSLGSYHNVLFALGASQSWDEAPFPCAGQTVADLRSSRFLHPIARRGAFLKFEWLCGIRVRRYWWMRRLLTLRAAERNVPRSLHLDVSRVFKRQSVSCR
jgi:hypothetical protein